MYCYWNSPSATTPQDALLALERNHLRTFKEVIPFKGLPRVLLTQYFISQFSLHFLFHLKLKRLLSRSSFLKTGRFVICTSNVPTTPGVGPELYLSGDARSKLAVTQR